VGEHSETARAAKTIYGRSGHPGRFGAVSQLDPRQSRERCEAPVSRRRDPDRALRTARQDLVPQCRRYGAIRSSTLRDVMLSKIAKKVLILGIASFVETASLGQDVATQAPRKILFVGDSFTYYQNGIYTHFERLAAAATPPLVVTADKSCLGAPLCAACGI